MNANCKVEYIYFVLRVCIELWRDEIYKSIREVTYKYEWVLQTLNMSRGCSMRLKWVWMRITIRNCEYDSILLIFLNTDCWSLEHTWLFLIENRLTFDLKRCICFDVFISRVLKCHGCNETIHMYVCRFSFKLCFIFVLKNIIFFSVFMFFIIQLTT